MRSFTAGLMMAAALTGAAEQVAAQGVLPFTLEVRAGPAFPTGEFGPSVKVGYLIESTAKVSPLPFVSVYVGWTFAEFGAEDDAGFAGTDTQVEDSGLRVGGELGVPLVGLMIGVAPYVQAGALFNRAEVEVVGDESGTLGFKSDRSRGFELAGGIRTLILPSLSLTPEVRYRKYDPDFGTAPEVGLADAISYVVASLGVTLHF